MYKKYKFPLQLFIYFEKINPALWTSAVSNKNCFYLLLPGASNLSLAVLLKNELFLGPNFLVDASCVDMQGMHRTGLKVKSSLIFYIFYFFFLKKRIVFCFPSFAGISAVDSVYSNANWLEREFVEMFGVSLASKVDARNLLLDYSLSENPLIKEFPSVGLREVHYSVLAESVVYSAASSVEL